MPSGTPWDPGVDETNIVRVAVPVGVIMDGVEEAVAGVVGSPNVNLPCGTCGELTASPNPSLRGTNKVGVLGTMQSSPPSSYPCGYKVFKDHIK